MLTGTYFYSFDTKSKPGKVICEGIRFETVEIEQDLTQVNILCDSHAELRSFNIKALHDAITSNFEI